MPRFTRTQHAFNAGQWSSRMRGRTDLAQYAASAEVIKNFQITTEGALIRRSGSRFVTEVADSSDRHYALPFIFSDDTAYVLEFGNRQIRVLTNEGLLLQPTLVGVTADDALSEFTSIGHGYRDGDGPVRLVTNGTQPPELLPVTTDFFVSLPPTLNPVATNGSNLFTSVAHGLEDGMGPFRFFNISALPNGIFPETDYFIVNETDDTFQVELEIGIGAKTFSTDGAGTHTMFPTGAYKRDKFRVSLTSGGAPIDFATSTGSYTVTPQAPISPIVIDSPYELPEIESITARGNAQSADVLYLTHEKHVRRKLTRHSAHGFFMEDADELDGPYLDENTTDITMIPSLATGKNISIVASAAIFTPSDIGRLIRINGDNHWGYAKISGVAGLAFSDSSIRTATFDPSGVNTGNNRITTDAVHGMTIGELIRFKEGRQSDLPDGLFEGTDYFVDTPATDELRFYLTKADAISGSDRVTIEDTGAGGITHFITSAEVNIGTHGLTDAFGPVQLVNQGGALPEGLTEDTNYFIVRVDADHFMFSLSPGGAPVGIDRAGGFGGGGIHVILGTDGSSFTTVSAIVKSDFDPTIVSGGTPGETAQWRLGAFSSDPLIGYPGSVVLHDQRAWMSANPGAPQTLYGSRAGGFESFSPSGVLTSDITDLDSTIAADNGITYTIGDSEQNAIRWLSSIRSLVMGTKAGAWTAGAATVRDAIAPGNFTARQSGRKGAAAIRPVIFDEEAVYISETGLKAYAITYAPSADAYTARDLTQLSRDITGQGVSEFSLASEPYSTAFGVRTDGKLAGLTRITSEQVNGWSLTDLGGGGIVESIAVIPAPEGDPSGIGRENLAHSQVWMIVRRTINGETVRYWEFFEDTFDDLFDTIDNGFFLDCGLTYTGGATTTIQGATHLIGETVDVLAGGQTYKDLVVDGTGMLSLPDGSAAATPWQIGYSFDSDLGTQRLPLQGPEGSAETKLGRVDHMTIRLDATAGGKYGPDQGNLTGLAPLLAPASLPTDTIPDLFSDDVEVSVDSGYDTAQKVFLRQSDPLPMTILSVTLSGDKGARGDRSK